MSQDDEIDKDTEDWLTLISGNEPGGEVDTFTRLEAEALRAEILYENTEDDKVLDKVFERIAHENSKDTTESQPTISPAKPNWLRRLIIVASLIVATLISFQFVMIPVTRSSGTPINRTIFVTEQQATADALSNALSAQGFAHENTTQEDDWIIVGIKFSAENSAQLQALLQVYKSDLKLPPEGEFELSITLKRQP